MDRLASDLVRENPIPDATVGKRATTKRKPKSSARADVQLRCNIVTKENALRGLYVPKQGQTLRLIN